ncbi:hypothetical protein CCHR01_18971 [Colletotrichum chrysophilum]|uniref:Uncharacterized protein n=1 Tax=Colletotrichum chrysophilum TaxID=1836956 RepID=A0AAD8ZZS0_9PEZI|nr:hypothetical protein CCHR01_18971 [Colletotrichum chrysophilum]
MDPYEAPDLSLKGASSTEAVQQLWSSFRPGIHASRRLSEAARDREIDVYASWLLRQAFLGCLGHNETSPPSLNTVDEGHEADVTGSLDGAWGLRSRQVVFS